MITGKTIAITRSPDDSEEFINLMNKSDAKAIPLPTIELVSKGDKIVEDFLNALTKYDPDYSVFMSSKAVKLLFDTARKIAKFEELRLAVANTIVIAVGPKTKKSLEIEGIKVNHMPQRFSSVGVGEIFTKLSAVGKKVIIPRSGASTPFLKDLLTKIGLEVFEIYLYNVRPIENTSQWKDFKQLFESAKVDGIIFTSASSVRAFFEIMKKDFDEQNLQVLLGRTRIVSIGPFTAEELKKFNIKNTISQVHTVEGAFETIKNLFSIA